MTLKDAIQGQEITLIPKGIIYIKGEHQGLHDRYVNLRSKTKYNTRCQRLSYRNKLLDQVTVCYPVEF